MSEYRYTEPEVSKDDYDPERKPFARPGFVAPDRTGQLWWRGPMDLSKNNHSMIFFRVIGPPRLRESTRHDENILGEKVVYTEYDYDHPIHQIIPPTDYQYGKYWWEGYHSWESEDHGPNSSSVYTRVHED